MCQFSQQHLIKKESTASDIVHLTNNNILKGYPAWSIVMPWENLNIKDKFENYPDIFLE